MSSLDQHYLEFRDKTAGVFSAFPQLEPMRHVIFKEILAKGETPAWIESIKRWVRPVVRRPIRTGILQPADVLVLVETTREVVVDSLLPVCRELARSQISTQIVALRCSESFPGTVYRIEPACSPFAPRWCSEAWFALAALEPALRDREARRGFWHAASFAESRLQEISHVLDVVRPKVVLSAASNLAGGAALVVEARYRGITSMLLQHGIPQIFYTPILDDLILAWGETSCATLRQLGTSARKLLPVGSPRHDHMVGIDRNVSRSQMLAKLGLADRRTLCFFSNGNDLVRNGDGPLHCARWLETAASRFDGRLNVIVRLHPNEDGSLYKNCPHLRVTKGVPDLSTTLAGSDIVASLCSTALDEALLFHGSVWHFESEGWPALADNWRTGRAVRIASENQLCELIAQSFSEPCPRSGLGNTVHQVFANHGRAAQAAAAAVIERLSCCV